MQKQASSSSKGEVRNQQQDGKKLTKTQKKKMKRESKKQKYGSSTTPEGLQICYAYNGDGCTKPNCQFKHVCQRCFQDHSARNCSAADS